MDSTVQDVMTKTVVVVNEDASFKEIVRLMQEYRVSAVPVVDGDDRVVGVVTEGDLILKEGTELEAEAHVLESRRRKIQRLKASGIVAGELMTHPAETIGPHATLAEAARKMHRLAVKHLPVVDERGKLVGIVSRVDLLRVFLRPDREIRQDIEETVIARTLWIDPATIRVTVAQGVVTLEGELERRSLIEALIEIVRAVPGVVSVRSRLSFQQDDTAVAGLVSPWMAYAEKVSERP